jgi:hypothetical protein
MFTLVSLDPIFHTLYIFRVSLFLLSLRSTIVIFFMFCVIFVGLSLIACSFYALALYSFRHIVMLPRLVIPLIAVLFLTVVLFLLIVFSLVVLSLLERL